MFKEIDAIKDLAFKYSKQQLGSMAQSGLIDTQKAVLAAMMRDRVAKEDTKPPTTTVAQDVLPPQQMGMPQEAPVQMAASGGITSLPVQEQDYAGGGIVAFADGGDTDDGVKHFDQGGFNFPAGSLLGMYERRPTAGGVAMDELQALDAQIAQTPPGPMRDRMIQTREFTAAKAAKANTQQFPSGIIATPEGQQAQQNVGITTDTNPFYTPPTPTPAAAADKTGANKAPATNVGGPRLPALKEPTGKIDIQEYNAKPVQELDVLAKERSEAYRKAGIDPDLYKGMIEKEEGKREGLGKRKEEAKGEFLMNLGLGLVGARRGQEGERFSDSAKNALLSYKDSMKDVRATEEKLEDRINSFKLADQQAKKTGTDADIAKRDRQGELVEAAKIKNIEARNAANAEEAKVQANIYGTKMQADTARYVAGVNAQTQREYTAALKQQGLQDSQIKNIMGTAAEIQKNKINAGNTEFTMEQAIKEAMAGYRQVAPLAGREVPAAGGLRRDANGAISYVPAT